MTPLESFDHQQLNSPNVPSSNRSIAQRLRRERERALARQSPNPKQKVDINTALKLNSHVVVEEPRRSNRITGVQLSSTCQ